MRFIEFVTYNFSIQMLNATTGASTLPRDLIQWLDKLDLSYSVRNPKMDLSNGFIIAEILTRCFPKDTEKMNILTYYNCQAKDKKFNNWQQLTKFLATKKFKITKEEYQSIINLEQQTAQNFLFRLYEFLTGNELNTDKRLASLLPEPDQPLYKKFTASHTAKDRSLHRIVDLKQKEFRTKVKLEKQKNNIHTQKYNSGLIDWLIDKRKKEIETEVNKQRQEMQRKTKSIIQNESKVEVREIQLKCFNSSTSKNNKGDGEMIETKGVLEFLAESCSLLFKKENIGMDIKRLGLEIKDKQISNLSIIQEIFQRCDQIDEKGNRKVSAETLNRLIDQFKKTTEMNLIIDNINGNFIDFKKFFTLFLKPLRSYDRQSEVFKNSINMLGKVATGMHKKDSQNTEMLFQELALQQFLKIGENEFKRPLISGLILEFSEPHSDAYFSLIQKVKDLYINEPKIYASYLALFLDVICRNCESISENLWSEFLYYGFASMNSPSPTLRVNGAKIIGQLFTQIAVASEQVINEKMQALQKLVVDPWWEVKAQAIIIYRAILLARYKNNSQNSSDNLNEDLNTKTILHFILDIFKPEASHNILRVGLIELAELLNYDQSLCERYLQILLHVGAQIRADVLNTSVIKYGPVVYGANTFNYKLTGAPLAWNSIGLVKALYKKLQENGKEEIEYPHLQILKSAILRNSESGTPEDWLGIFQNYKSMIFKSFLDEELCSMVSIIVKEFLKIEEIHIDLVQSCRGEISRTLSQLYIDVGESDIKTNFLEFFEYLKQTESQYTYKILKDFAQREKQKYLSSNLVDFMNDLTRNRRKLLFNEV